MLLWRGWPFFERLEGGSSTLVPSAALAIGAAKGWFIFRRTSGKNIERIRSEPEPRWFWRVYPLYLYVLIPVMIAFGVWIRYTLGEGYPWVVVLVYFSVGAALLASSVPYFRAGARSAKQVYPTPGQGVDPAHAEVE
jgi:hypothetical protein